MLLLLLLLLMIGPSRRGGCSPSMVFVARRDVCILCFKTAVLKPFQLSTHASVFVVLDMTIPVIRLTLLYRQKGAPLFLLSSRNVETHVGD